MDPDRDAGFVAELVASPGDDGPRLVYADWLADRDDPRAAYLRAELAWAAAPADPAADQAPAGSPTASTKSGSPASPGSPSASVATGSGSIRPARRRPQPIWTP